MVGFCGCDCTCSACGGSCETGTGDSSQLAVLGRRGISLGASNSINGFGSVSGRDGARAVADVGVVISLAVFEPIGVNEGSAVDTGADAITFFRADFDKNGSFSSSISLGLLIGVC